ncbi:MAG: exodeoxyribonuclease VII large subunit [Burkholderiaceae bacterium]
MALDFGGSERATARDPLTVSALNRAVAGLLERSFPLVRVQGEVANLTRAASGHWYFVLKDDQAQVRCVMFRGRNQLLNWTPRDGDEVELSAVVSLYEARGEFQLTIESMRRAGQGRLFEEFVRLKAKLAAEGLFATEVKRALPDVPRRVGIVTSLQAAALRDVLTCLARRAPYVTVIVYPVPVQGAGAGQRIAAMLRTASHRAEVDVVLLVRGGGSIEDLWAFNEEAVARAIRASALPVVVGVGHESDITIADFAADLRAPTPTAAAEVAAPSRDALLGEVTGRLQPLKRCLLHHLHRAEQRLDYAQRALATPRAPLAALDARAASLHARLQSAANRAVSGRRLVLGRQRETLLRLRLTGARGAPGAAFGRLVTSVLQQRHAAAMRLAALGARLDALDPHAVLKRGYAMAVSAEGAIVTDAARLARGDVLTLRFARGGAAVQVQALLPDRTEAGDDP